MAEASKPTYIMKPELMKPTSAKAQPFSSAIDWRTLGMSEALLGQFFAEIDLKRGQQLKTAHAVQNLEVQKLDAAIAEPILEPAQLNESNIAGSIAKIGQKTTRTGAASQYFLVRANVQGSMRLPYQTSLQLKSTRGVMELSAHCTCPQGEKRCKHAAALGFSLVTRSGPASEAKAPSTPGSAMAQFMAELRSLHAQEQAANATIAAATDANAHARGDLNEPRLFLQFSLVDDVNGNDNLFKTVLVRPLMAVLEGDRLHIQTELSPHRLLPQHASVLGVPDTIALKELSEFEPQLNLGRFSYPLDGRRGAVVLLEHVRWQRVVMTGAMGEPLKIGPSRVANFDWHTNGRGEQQLWLTVAGTEGSVELLHTEPPLYLDRHNRQLGTLQLPLSLIQTRQLLSRPAVKPIHMDALVTALQQSFGELIPTPKRYGEGKSDLSNAKPTLMLSLSADREALLHRKLKRRLGLARQFLDVNGERVPVRRLRLGFDRLEGSTIVRYQTNDAQLQIWQNQLQAVGLSRAEGRLLGVDTSENDADWVINPDFDEQTLTEFCFLRVPELRAQGWIVDFSAGFPLKLIDKELRIVASISGAGSLATPAKTKPSANANQAAISNFGDDEGADRYFDLELGIEIDGKLEPLLPILAAGVAQGRYKELPNNADAIVALMLPDGRPIPIHAGRLKMMLSLLEDLGSAGSARLPHVRAGLLEELSAGLGEQLEFRGGDALRALAERLRDVGSVLDQPISPPKALQGTLRPYQLQGLRWLRFLRESGLAGILADDMGLGKTIQVLAHVLLERERGQTLPVLVIAPTSVLPNWQAEVTRFAPSLSMINLSGSKRKPLFDQIQTTDLVFTSYALVGRDIAELSLHRFSLVVLDEAQMVKNPSTLAAKAARKIQAEHRLCMTGTPLENHLGDLWAQFDFLMPGFLGTRSSFQKRFRTPIEKRRDLEVARTLKDRILPFLLRRTKDQVVKELPPKSLIVKRIDLEGKQRDLYETVRLSLRVQVQQSADRNRIQLLDALLKLRQICCDPRLLKLDAAKTAGSAKLEQLCDMLGALVSEGRRILVFSQFTSMLSLIEEELKRRKLRYLILTGQNDDRETPVLRFQRKEVPIFLISLRAGGFGLNLTAADTVIHYDPWWNPAVEEQATDRAYRIGQEKPVFVYRLIAAGSIEERIEQMKDKKRELLGTVLDGGDATTLSDADLLSLLDDV